ncbi:STAS domain-containing protein [Marinobacter daepoensis]|uniref:STAS domain-containing protein n=1 Tax=Marinobacter daepoensis TaxID=262077 RepID=A0ABS3BHA7_9GAMM|nr:STAS domain-containing protein [Marinobacter daepoensis]MBN7771210.1 STAS domain-containing protein [Marinobacter daepoensis]MBY6079072.1 STAS domain-containing protein [Marinobacter daepoensis]
MSEALPGLAREGSALRVTGVVTAENVVALRQQGEQEIRQAGGVLEIDLSGLETAHSVVLSLLLCWQRLALRQDCQLSFSGASERLRSLAALSNLQEQIPGFAGHS